MADDEAKKTTEAPKAAEAAPAGDINTSTAKKDIPTLGKDQIYVKIYAPFKSYYDGVASSISAVNDTGPFDILGQHHNFISILNAGEVIVRDDQGEHKINIDRAIMHVKANQIVVFLDV